MKLNYAIGSDRGLVRKNNEDSAYAGPNLLALADGMGGHAAGEVASQLMITHLEQLDANPDDNDMLALLASVADDANHAIAKQIREMPETTGMGTTLTALMFNGVEFGLCHVGDSRGYRLRAGKLERITVDDTYVQSLVDRGELDPEDVSTHPQRSMILKAYTGRPVNPTLTMLDAQIGDRIMLCSDGLSDPVTSATIESTLAEGTPQEAVDRLIELALRSGGPDNVTVVVADVVAGDTDDSQLPTVPVQAGALDGEQKEDPRPDTAAGRAAIALSKGKKRQPKTIEPSVHQNSAEGVEKLEKPKKRRGVWIVVFVLLVIAGAGGYFYVSNMAKERYFIAATEESNLVVYQGVNSEFLPGMWKHPYQKACLNDDGNLTMIPYDDQQPCHLFSLNDLKATARGSAAALPGGSYDDVLQEMQRLANELLPVCVVRASTTPKPNEPSLTASTPPTSTKVGDGNLNTPGVTCREVSSS
jgi:hypothetical protein